MFFFSFLNFIYANNCTCCNSSKSILHSADHWGHSRIYNTHKMFGRCVCALCALNEWQRKMPKSGRMQAVRADWQHVRTLRTRSAEYAHILCYLYKENLMLKRAKRKTSHKPPSERDYERFVPVPQLFPIAVHFVFEFWIMIRTPASIY